MLPWMRQSRGPPASWWIWSRTPEHHREKISGSPAPSLLLKANTKKIELLQSAKVLALNIQKHLKLRGGKLREKTKTKTKNREPGLLPLPLYPLWHCSNQSSGTSTQHEALPCSKSQPLLRSSRPSYQHLQHYYSSESPRSFSKHHATLAFGCKWNSEVQRKGKRESPRALVRWQHLTVKLRAPK